MYGMLYKISKIFSPSTFRFGSPTLNAMAPALSAILMCFTNKTTVYREENHIL